MAAHDVISHAELRERIRYEPETGKFFWLINHSAKAKVGQELGSWDLYGYKTVRIYKRSYKLHRLAWFYMTGEWPKGDIDHINGVRCDNKWSNLRDVSRKSNLENSLRIGSHKKSELPRGVSIARDKFSAKISHNNKPIHLGTYWTPEEAGAAYMAAKRLLHAGHVSEDRLEALAA